MGIHVAVIGKLNLLAGGQGNCQILAALLCPFALKLPFLAARLPNSFAQLAVSLRFFLFRLGRIAAYGRWERAIGLISGRRRHGGVLRPTDEILASISMLAL